MMLQKYTLYTYWLVQLFVSRQVGCESNVTTYYRHSVEYWRGLRNWQDMMQAILPTPFMCEWVIFQSNHENKLISNEMIMMRSA